MEREQLRRLIRLARLEVAPEEEERLLEQVARILARVQRIQELQLGEETVLYFYPNAPRRRLRGDVPRKTNFREAFLRNAPARWGGYLVVPPVLTEKPRD